MTITHSLYKSLLWIIATMVVWWSFAYAQQATFMNPTDNSTVSSRVRFFGTGSAGHDVTLSLTYSWTTLWSQTGDISTGWYWNIQWSSLLVSSGNYTWTLVTQSWWSVVWTSYVNFAIDPTMNISYLRGRKDDSTDPTEIQAIWFTHSWTVYSIETSASWVYLNGYDAYGNAITSIELTDDQSALYTGNQFHVAVDEQEYIYLTTNLLQWGCLFSWTTYEVCEPHGWPSSILRSFTKIDNVGNVYRSTGYTTFNSVDSFSASINDMELIGWILFAVGRVRGDWSFFGNGGNSDQWYLLGIDIFNGTVVFPAVTDPDTYFTDIELLDSGEFVFAWVGLDTTILGFSSTVSGPFIAKTDGSFSGLRYTGTNSSSVSASYLEIDGTNIYVWGSIASSVDSFLSEPAKYFSDDEIVVAQYDTHGNRWRLSYATGSENEHIDGLVVTDNEEVYAYFSSDSNDLLSFGSWTYDASSDHIFVTRLDPSDGMHITQVSASGAYYPDYIRPQSRSYWLSAIAGSFTANVGVSFLWLSWTLFPDINSHSLLFIDHLLTDTDPYDFWFTGHEYLSWATVISQWPSILSWISNYVEIVFSAGTGTITVSSGWSDRSITIYENLIAYSGETITFDLPTNFTDTIWSTSLNFSVGDDEYSFVVSVRDEVVVTINNPLSGSMVSFPLTSSGNATNTQTGDYVTIIYSGTVVGSSSLDSLNWWARSLLTPDQGDWSILVEVTPYNRNNAQIGSTVTATINADSTNPTITISPQTALWTTSIITWTLSESGTINVSVNGQTFSDTLSSAGTRTWNLSTPLWIGTYTVFATGTDDLGHLWTWSQTVTIDPVTFFPTGRPQRFGSSGNDIVNDVAVDTEGNVYTVWSFQEQLTLWATTLTSNGEDDVVVIKYNSGWVIQRATGFGQADFDRWSSLALDSDGSVYIAGSFKNNDLTRNGTTLTHQGNRDIFVTKLTSWWAMEFLTGGWWNFTDVATDMAISADGLIHLAVQTSSTPFVMWTISLTNDSYDFSLLTLNSWWVAQRWNNYHANGNDIALWVGVDHEGNITVVWHVDNLSQAHVRQYSSGGSFLRSGTFTGGTTHAQSVVVDSQWSITVHGYYSGASVSVWGVILPTSTDTDAFLVNYSSWWVVQRATWFGWSDDDVGYDITTDSQDNTIVVGHYSGSMTLWSTTLTSNGQNDTYVATFSSGWSIMHSTWFGWSDNEYWYGIAVDIFGYVYVWGYYDSLSMNVGGRTLESNGPSDAYITRFPFGSGISSISTPDITPPIVITWWLFSYPSSMIVTGWVAYGSSATISMNITSWTIGNTYQFSGAGLSWTTITWSLTSIPQTVDLTLITSDQHSIFTYTLLNSSVILWIDTGIVHHDTTSPSVPILVSPADTSTVSSSTVTFDRSDSTDSGVWTKQYSLEFADNATFNSSTTHHYSWSLSTGAVFTSGTYYRRVYATDFLDTRSATTTSRSFTVINDDITPDQMTFIYIPDAELDTTYRSNLETVFGMSDGVTTTMTISQWTLIINGIIQWSRSATIQNNDTVEIQITSSDDNDIAISSLVTIGWMQATFTVETRDSDFSEFESGEPYKINIGGDDTPEEDTPVTITLEVVDIDDEPIDNYDERVWFSINFRDSSSDSRRNVTEDTDYVLFEDGDVYNFSRGDNGYAILEDFIEFRRDGEFNVIVEEEGNPDIVGSHIFDVDQDNTTNNQHSSGDDDDDDDDNDNTDPFANRVPLLTAEQKILIYRKLTTQLRPYPHSMECRLLVWLDELIDERLFESQQKLIFLSNLTAKNKEAYMQQILEYIQDIAEFQQERACY